MISAQVNFDTSRHTRRSWLLWYLAIFDDKHLPQGLCNFFWLTFMCMPSFYNPEWGKTHLRISCPSYELKTNYLNRPWKRGPAETQPVPPLAVLLWVTTFRAGHWKQLTTFCWTSSCGRKECLSNRESWKQVPSQILWDLHQKGE